jgi:hypothetical protein
LAVFPAKALALWPTPIPVLPSDILNPEISIPDTALSEKLHILTGVRSNGLFLYGCT